MTNEYIKFIIAYDCADKLEEMDLACDEAFELAEEICKLYNQYVLINNYENYYETLLEFLERISFEDIWKRMKKYHKTTIKEAMIKQFEYCYSIAQDIIKNEGIDVKGVIEHAKKYAEIESPMTGETDACWIRISYGEIYLFIHFHEPTYRKTGCVTFVNKISYQLDTIGAYGAELIDEDDALEFIKKLAIMDEEKILENYYELSTNGDYFKDIPSIQYKPY